MTRRKFQPAIDNYTQSSGNYVSRYQPSCPRCPFLRLTRPAATLDLGAPRLTAYVDVLRQRGNAIQSILSRLHQLDRGAKRAWLQFSGELLALGIRLMAAAETTRPRGNGRSAIATG